jgi:hypothetical protein
MEKEIENVIKETCHKKWGGNKVRKFANYFIIDEQASQCATTKSARIYFEYNWFTTIVREVG